jgi:hypothetical protein
LKDSTQSAVDHLLKIKKIWRIFATSASVKIDVNNFCKKLCLLDLPFLSTKGLFKKNCLVGMWHGQAVRTLGCCSDRPKFNYHPDREYDSSIFFFPFAKTS